MSLHRQVPESHALGITTTLLPFFPAVGNINMKLARSSILDNKELRLMASGPEKRDSACALRISAGTDGTRDRRVGIPSPLLL